MATQAEKAETTNQPIESKMSRARAIFKEMYGKEGIERKHIINRFMEELPMSRFGASTYFHNIKTALKKEKESKK